MASKATKTQAEALPELQFSTAKNGAIIPPLGNTSLIDYVKIHFVGRAVSPDSIIEAYDTRQDNGENRAEAYKLENLPTPTTGAKPFFVRFANFALSFNVHLARDGRFFFSRIAIWKDDPVRYTARLEKGRARRFSPDADSKFVRHSFLASRSTPAGKIWDGDSFDSAGSQWSLVIAQMVANEKRWIANLDNDFILD